MKTILLKEGAKTDNSAVICTATRKMVRKRSVELALINGRSAQDVSKSDWEQAKRELTVEPRTYAKESTPENPLDLRTLGQSSSLTTIENQLLNHPFLKEMKPEHLAILARHASGAEFRVGQVIFRQNENAHQFYLVLEGKVAVESYMARANNLPLQIVTAGDVLGWSWLFPPFVWHFQAVALEPTKAILLDGASLLAACGHNHCFGYQLMERVAQVVVKRLEAAQRRVSEIKNAAGTLPVVEEPKHEKAAGRLVGESVADMLAAHPFSKGLAAEHLKLLANSARESMFDAGQVIFREGDLSNRFYLIQRGKVVLEAMGTETSPAQLQIISDGDVLGWSWLFPPYYSHYAARALEPTQSIFLYGTRLREQCEQNYEFGYALMKRTVAVMIQRLQAARGLLVESSALNEGRTTNADLQAMDTKTTPSTIGASGLDD